MGIVGGLDIHRKQITFHYVDTVTGQVSCGQIGRADRARLRMWLRKNGADREDVAFAVEACTGWRYVVEELTAANVEAHLGEPAETAAARGRKRRAKTDRSDSRLLRELLEQAGCPNAGSRRHMCWNAGRCCRRIWICGSSTRPGCSVFTRCVSTRAPRRWTTVGCPHPKPGPAGSRPPGSSCPRPGSTRWPSPQGSWTSWRPSWRRCASG
jgi:hypothetical protein